MMTERQDKFIEHYSITGNATQSAICLLYTSDAADE